MYRRRRALLLKVARAALTIPLLVAIPGIRPAPAQGGDPPSTAPRFEVAVVKPTDQASRSPIGWFTYPGGRITISQVSLKQIVALAYGVQQDQVTGGPAWARNDMFDITALAPADSEAAKFVPKSSKVVPPKESLLMLQTLLADRFQLKLHTETKVEPGFRLIVAKGSPRLAPPKDPDDYSVVAFGRTENPNRPWFMQGYSASMAKLAARLSDYLHMPVSDETGLGGQFDFYFEFARDQTEPDSGPSLFVALQEQVGLKLAPAKLPYQVLVINHAERPAGN
jgi:uncharacterized protein (TIGR03435 family)